MISSANSSILLKFYNVSASATSPKCVSSAAILSQTSLSALCKASLLP
jgi:hypothetical protein